MENSNDTNKELKQEHTHPEPSADPGAQIETVIPSAEKDEPSSESDGQEADAPAETETLAESEQPVPEAVDDAGDTDQEDQPQKGVEEQDQPETPDEQQDKPEIADEEQNQPEVAENESGESKTDEHGIETISP